MEMFDEFGGRLDEVVVVDPFVILDAVPLITDVVL